MLCLGRNGFALRAQCGRDVCAPGIKSRLTSEVVIIKETGERDREGIMSWNQQPSWNRSQTGGPAIISSEQDAALVGAFLAKVYLWMFVGLLITSVTAFTVAASPALVEALIVNRLGFWLIVIANLVLSFTSRPECTNL